MRGVCIACALAAKNFSTTELIRAMDLLWSKSQLGDDATG